MVRTGYLMFDWLGEKNPATRLENAIAKVIRENRVGTYDVGLSNTTKDVVKEMQEAFSTSAPRFH
jgi:isocitrate/isopropylmalate dehydrogenase